MVDQNANAYKYHYISQEKINGLLARFYFYSKQSFAYCLITACQNNSFKCTTNGSQAKFQIEIYNLFFSSFVWPMRQRDIDHIVEMYKLPVFFSSS